MNKFPDKYYQCYNDVDNMDYRRIYQEIIDRRLSNKFEGYTEKHHIVPRSLGGTNDRNNLVNLSAREHYICHLLLTKFFEVNSVEWKKMIKAFSMMTYCKNEFQERYIRSKDYGKLREEISKIRREEQMGSKNSQYGNRWIHNDITREIKQIKDYMPLPDGWEYGKKFDINKLKEEKLQRIEQKKIDRINSYKYLYEWYEIYDNYGFEKFVEITGYNKSKQNLVILFSRNLDIFVPQNGVKRGKKL